MSVNDIDVCQVERYQKFKEFIEQETPLQTWIEPIPYRNWKGFVNELSHEDRDDQVDIEFSGRVIDFNDLKRSIKDQNDERTEDAKVEYSFKHVKILSDKELAKNIDEVVKELKLDRFRQLVEERTSQVLKTKYEELEENYARAKNTEFQIVFAGLYSSGKSTLINALIGHNILPTSNNTCTSKNCEIRHNKNLKSNETTLTCFNENGKKTCETLTFNNDDECSALFKTICPIDGINESYSNVDTLEIGVNLSHLYPKSVSDDKFTIVLIDTPGMNSSKSITNGRNLHAEISLDAISDKSKPMIILCAGGQDYESEAIGKFMLEIVSQSKEDGGGFNDRFLFLMNKCDTIGYQKNESPEIIKNKFAKYLTDSSKWGNLAENENIDELIEEASHFVPRIFMTNAFVAFAIKMKAFNFSDEELAEDSYKDNLLKEFDNFCDNIFGRRKRPYYFLARYCDIPNYQKDIIEEEFKQAVNDEDEVRATELQCGLVSVEMAIKDYIEKYAFPIKVRDLLDTFEDILADVDCFTNATLASLKNEQKELGEKSSERKEAKERKLNVNEKIAVLKTEKEKIDNQLDALDKIVFDNQTLNIARTEFRKSIYKDDIVAEITKNNRIFTGYKNHSDVVFEIKEKISHIQLVFDDAIKKTNHQVECIKNKHDNQIFEIFTLLKEIVKHLENSGILKYGDYDFTSSIIWKRDFATIDSQNFVNELCKEIVDGREFEKRRNTKRDAWRSSWNLFKKIGALFMDEYTYVRVDKKGFYDTLYIQNSIGDYFKNMAKECENMKNKFISELENSKNKVRTMLTQLSNELQNFIMDINAQEEKIILLSSSINSLNSNIENYKKTLNWLNELKIKIEGL